MTNFDKLAEGPAKESEEDLPKISISIKVPDLLEPAIHSHHRKFFHSVTAGAATTYAAFGNHIEEWDDSVKKPVQAAAIAYVSHLAADATTPRGIALVHPKFV